MNQFLNGQRSEDFPKEDIWVQMANKPMKMPQITKALEKRTFQSQ